MKKEKRKPKVNPKQASVLACMVQCADGGKRAFERGFKEYLHGDALKIAQVLMGDLKEDEVKPKIKNAVKALREWRNQL